MSGAACRGVPGAALIIISRTKPTRPATNLHFQDSFGPRGLQSTDVPLGSTLNVLISVGNQTGMRNILR